MPAHADRNDGFPYRSPGLYNRVSRARYAPGRSPIRTTELMSTLITRKLQQAHSRLKTGDFIGAAFLCEEVLESAPRNPEASWLLGTARLMGGDARSAVPFLEHAVTAAPQNLAALDSLGLALLMLGRYAQAERVLRTVSETRGVPGVVHMRLGLALLNQAKYPEAISELQFAIDLNPTDIDAQLNLGQAYGRAGDGERARAVFQSILATSPQHPDALYNLGVLCLQDAKLEEAKAWFERALACSPQHADAWINLGVVLQKQERLEDATAALHKALALAPGSAIARAQLGIVLTRLGDGKSALKQFVDALRMDPQQADAREGAAMLYLAAGRYREAIAELRELLRLEPANAAAYTSLASALLQVGAVDEAEQAALSARALTPAAGGAYSVLAQISVLRGALDKAVEVLEQGHNASGAATLLGLLVNVLARTCEWERWQPMFARMAAELERGAIVGSPFYLLTESTTPQLQLSYARRWAHARFGASTESLNRAKTRRSGPLRVGYLSSDFQQHAVGYLIVEALEHHNHDRVEVFAYSYGPDDQSAMRSRFAAAVDHFVEIAREADDEVVDRMRRDELDVLVDLKGYTLGDRLSIMARRPCATQVTWLGYPGTTGAPFIDYLIADPFVIPPDTEDAYSEKIIRLPHCYQPNDSSRPVVEPLERRAYGLPHTAFVFCCFNQASKIKPEIFACWMRLLSRIPNSVLWLLEDNKWATANLAAAAMAAGIVADRVIFAPRLPQAQHLARYGVANLALDTLPYTSHTTANDSLWMGCPLVALCGDTFASRVSASILKSRGMTDLVTYTLDEYESLACRLAMEATEMQSVRARLRSHDARAVLDSAALARALEALYVEIAG